MSLVVFRGYFLGLLLALAAACGCSTSANKNQVLVLGAIHGRHKLSSVYGVDKIQEIVRRYNPDYILAEIPPGRLSIALDEYRKTGTIEEPRVKVFPEYVEAVIPLTREMDFIIVPCAAWTQEMADDRREKLKRWKTERPEDSDKVERAQVWAQMQIRQEGLAEDPLQIHTGRYDEIVKKGMEPYNRLFNDDLGAGGWDNINAAHYTLISDFLDQHSYQGLRCLIIFGSWHKYWFIEQLQKRDDIQPSSLTELLGPPAGSE